MSLQQQIEHLQLRITELDKQAAHLSRQSWELQERRASLIAQMILNEGMLKDTTWDIKLSGTTHNHSDVFLSYTGSIDEDTPMRSIMNVARSSYHCDFMLMDGIELHFDDNKVALSFKESKMILPFLTKYGLLLNGSLIQDKLNKLKRDAAALELICHQLKL